MNSSSPVSPVSVSVSVSPVSVSVSVPLSPDSLSLDSLSLDSPGPRRLTRSTLLRPPSWDIRASQERASVRPSDGEAHGTACCIGPRHPRLTQGRFHPRSHARTRGRTSSAKRVISSRSGQPMNKYSRMPTSSRHSINACATLVVAAHERDRRSTQIRHQPGPQRGSEPLALGVLRARERRRERDGVRSRCELAMRLASTTQDFGEQRRGGVERLASRRAVRSSTRAVPPPSRSREVWPRARAGSAGRSGKVHRQSAWRAASSTATSDLPPT